jgi:hypothetical protein
MCGLLEIGLRGVIFAPFFFVFLADGQKDALFHRPVARSPHHLASAPGR